MIRWLTLPLFFAFLSLIGTRLDAQESQPIMMPELTVIGKATPYDENNPAVDLIHRTISAYKEQSAHLTDHSYQQYDRLQLSLIKIEKWHPFLRWAVPFFDNYLRYSKIDGSEMLPLSQREKIILKGYNSTLHRTNEVILYDQLVGINQNFHNGGESVRLEELLPKINLYTPYVRMLDTEFASPLGELGTEMYRYYLTDTVISRGHVAQVVDFFPRYPHAPSFSGRLEIIDTDRPQLLKSYLIFPKFTNVNFVNTLRLLQDYGQSDGHWCLQQEHLLADLEFYIHLLSANLEQVRQYSDYQFHTPDSAIVFAHHQFEDRQHLDLVDPKTTHSLTGKEILSSDEGLKHFMDEFRKLGWQRYMLELADMISLKYFRTGFDRNKVYGGSYFDIGPISDLIGVNPIEGLRMRLGGRSTAFLSRHHFLEGYVAYGTKDHKLKWQGTYAYTFRPKRYFRQEYPRHEVSLSYQYDLYTPGELIANNDQSNILYDVGVSYMTTQSYRTSWSAEYLHDFSPALSLRLYAKHHTDNPTGDLQYVRVNPDNSLEKLPEIVDVLAGVELRWSPGERIFEGSMQRQRLRNGVQKEVPVFRLRHEWADKRFGGDFNRQRTELIAEQRLWMGMMGRLDYQISLGKIWGSVPFPTLYTPPVNMGFIHRRNTFHLLSPLEYVADEWASAFLQYHMRGLVFDRLPILKNWSLRGVWTVNMLYGNLTPKNSQYSGDEIFVLPHHATEMNHKLYTEVGFGLENLFKVLRIDLYRRVTSRTPYSGSPWGVRADISVSF